jgi:hypothetical protein
VEYHKKFGMIVMVVSIVLAPLMFAMSERSIRCSDELTGIYFLMNCLNLEFVESIPGNEFSALFSIPLKYTLVFCVASFGAGFLWYQGAIKAPVIRKWPFVTRED